MLVLRTVGLCGSTKNLFSFDYNRCPLYRQPSFVAVGAKFGGNVTNNPQICLTPLASPILTKTCSLTQKENSSGIENTNILTPRWSSSKRCLTQPLALCWSLSLSLFFFWLKGYHILHSLPEALSQQDALCLEAISRTEHRWVINQSTCCSKCIRGSYSLETHVWVVPRQWSWSDDSEMVFVSVFGAPNSLQCIMPTWSKHICITGLHAYDTMDYWPITWLLL